MDPPGYGPLGAWLRYFDGQVQYNGRYGPLEAWLQYFCGQAQYNGRLGACGLRVGVDSRCAFPWGPYADLRDDFVQRSVLSVIVDQPTEVQQPGSQRSVLSVIVTQPTEVPQQGPRVVVGEEEDARGTQHHSRQPSTAKRPEGRPALALGADALHPLSL